MSFNLSATIFKIFEKNRIFDIKKNVFPEARAHYDGVEPLNDYNEPTS